MAQRVVIEYRDAKGATTRRVIQVRAVTAKDGSTFVQALCETRGSLRSFRADRIVSAFDPQTGEVLDPRSLWASGADAPSGTGRILRRAITHTRLIDAVAARARVPDAAAQILVRHGPRLALAAARGLVAAVAQARKHGPALAELAERARSLADGAARVRAALGALPFRRK